MAYDLESLSAPRVPTQRQSKDSVRRPGHCGRGQTLVSLKHLLPSESDTY